MRLCEKSAAVKLSGGSKSSSSVSRLWDALSVNRCRRLERARISVPHTGEVIFTPGNMTRRIAGRTTDGSIWVKQLCPRLATKGGRGYDMLLEMGSGMLLTGEVVV